MCREIYSKTNLKKVVFNRPPQLKDKYERYAKGQVWKVRRKPLEDKELEAKINTALKTPIISRRRIKPLYFPLQN